MKLKNIILINILLILSTILFMCTGQSANNNFFVRNSPGATESDIFEVVAFDYPVPDGMITDPAKKEAMIKAKINNLLETNAIYWGELPAELDDLLKLYADISNFINSNFTGFKGLDLNWDEFTQEYYDRMEHSKNYGEFAYIITKLGFALQEGHTQIMPSRLMGQNNYNFLRNKAPVLVTQPYSRIGVCYTVTENEELVISKLFEGTENPYKFYIGDEIVGFNGVPWKDWVDRLTDAGIPIFASPGGTKSAIRYNLLKSGMANINLFEKINIKRIDTGKIETLKVVYIDPKISLAYCTDLTQAKGINDWRRDIFTYGRLEGTNIGYIYLRSCPSGFDEFYIGEEWDPYKTEFSKTFENAILELMDTDGLIFDIRANDGGRPEPLYKGLAHLIKSEKAVYPFAAAQRDTSIPDRTTLKELKAYPWTPLKPDEPDKSYDKPIIIMTGPDCISACDMLVALMSRYKEFTIIGKDPNGSATQIAGIRDWYINKSNKIDKITTYLTNFTFFFPDEPGNYLMRRTDFLDKPVWFTKNDIANKIDTVREFAVKLVKGVLENTK